MAIKTFFKFILIFPILISFLYPGHSIAKTKGSFKVVLSKKNEGYPKKFQKKLEHPYEISETVLRKIIQNLYYIEKKSGRGWGEEKRVFTNAFTNRASALIKKALHQAKSSQKVILKTRNAKGEIVCDIFIKEEVLNFRFDKINGASRIHNKWKMVPKLAQRYYLPPKTNLAVDILKGGRYKDLTWIRVSLLEFAEEYQTEVILQSKDRPLSEDQEIVKESPEAPITLTQDNRPLNKLDKMKSIKSAFDNKLILRSEYRKKAIELLRSPTKIKMGLKDELFFLSLLKNDDLISEEYYNQKKKVLLENL